MPIYSRRPAVRIPPRQRWATPAAPAGVRAKVGYFNIGTGAAGTTVQVADAGFTPKVVIFWWNGATGLTNGQRGTSLRGQGWACSPSNFGVSCTRDEDAAGTSVADSGWRQDSCIAQQGDGVFIGWADLQSFNAGGFTLEILQAFTVDMLICYLAIGGDDITNAECGQFQQAVLPPANQTINNVGNFPPSITMFMIAGTQSAAPATSPDSQFMFGAATASSDDHVYMGGSNDAQANPIQTAALARAGECVVSNNNSPAGAPALRYEFVSNNASPGGFTVNCLERGTLERVMWLSIKGGAWAIGNLLTRTDGDPINITGLSARPAAGIVVSANRAQTAQDAAGASHDEWSMGAFTSASERVAAQIASRSGQTDTYVHRAIRNDAVYINSDPVNVSYVLQGLMDVTGTSASGFDLVMDDADPAQAFAWYIAVSPTS
jgi:hypothetical protein